MLVLPADGLQEADEEQSGCSARYFFMMPEEMAYHGTDHRAEENAAGQLDL